MVGHGWYFSSSGNVFEPFSHLNVWGALIRRAGLVDFLFRHEVVDVPVGQWNLILIPSAKFLLLCKCSWRYLGESIAYASNASIGE
jgi:hypothetical protein